MKLAHVAGENVGSFIWACVCWNRMICCLNKYQGLDSPVQNPVPRMPSFLHVIAELDTIASYFHTYTYLILPSSGGMSEFSPYPALWIPLLKILAPQLIVLIHALQKYNGTKHVHNQSIMSLSI